MNKHAVLHIPDSQYCYAIDMCSVSLRLRVAKDEDIKSIDVIYGCKYDYYRTQFSQPMEKNCSDGLYDYYNTTLKDIDPRLVYIFAIQSGERRYFYSEDGITDRYDFTLAYYSCFQLPSIHSGDLHKPVSWMPKAVFYQIFVERFCRDDFDKIDSYININWGDIPTSKSFAGGDLKGILSKFDYLQSLGVNTLYLTPMFLSPSNHKYDTIDYTVIDPQFGSNEMLKELIQSAHKRKMRVVLDAVFNHCSSKNALFEDVINKGKASAFYDWFLIYGDYPDIKKENYACFGSNVDMPRWNTSNPAVQDYLIGIAVDWTKNCGVDGWRLDVSDEVSHDMWRQFRKAIKAVNPHCVIIGENWHDARPYLLGDQHDSMMHYGLTKACLDYFASKSLNTKEMAERLSGLLMRNTDTVNSMMLNLLDSHDTERFLTRVKGDIDQLLSALALTVCFVGAPCIYYGTEIGIMGGQDPDCRKTFPWETKEWNVEILNSVKQLTVLKKLPELQTTSISIQCENDLLCIKRNGVILYINQSGNAQSVTGNILFARKYKDGFLQTGGFCIKKTEVV